MNNSSDRSFTNTFINMIDDDYIESGTFLDAVLSEVMSEERALEILEQNDCPFSEDEHDNYDSVFDFLIERADEAYVIEIGSLLDECLFKLMTEDQVKQKAYELYGEKVFADYLEDMGDLEDE